MTYILKINRRLQPTVATDGHNRRLKTVTLRL